MGGARRDLGAVGHHQTPGRSLARRARRSAHRMGRGAADAAVDLVEDQAAPRPRPASTTLSASRKRDSSPPEAMRPSGPGGRPGWSRPRKRHCSRPWGPQSASSSPGLEPGSRRGHSRASVAAAPCITALSSLLGCLARRAVLRDFGGGDQVGLAGGRGGLLRAPDEALGAGFQALPGGRLKVLVAARPRARRARWRACGPGRRQGEDSGPRCAPARPRSRSRPAEKRLHGPQGPRSARHWSRGRARRSLSSRPLRGLVGHGLFQQLRSALAQALLCAAVATPSLPARAVPAPGSRASTSCSRCMQAGALLGQGRSASPGCGSRVGQLLARHGAGRPPRRAWPCSKDCSAARR